MWNEVRSSILEHNTPIEKDDLLLCIPGLTKGSDLTVSTGTIKHKLKCMLLNIQARGYSTEWDPRNFNFSTYKGPNWTWGIGSS